MADGVTERYDSVWQTAVRLFGEIGMSSRARNDARLNFRLPTDLKVVIEEAAATLGQSVSDFAVSTLLRTAHSVLQQQSVTELTKHDRDRFIALLDDAEAKPTKALTEAARRYKKHLGQ